MRHAKNIIIERKIFFPNFYLKLKNIYNKRSNKINNAHINTKNVTIDNSVGQFVNGKNMKNVVNNIMNGTNCIGNKLEINGGIHSINSTTNTNNYVINGSP